jgi:hypothetical protein
MSNIPDLPQIPGVPDRLILSINERLRMIRGAPKPSTQMVRVSSPAPAAAPPPEDVQPIGGQPFLLTKTEDGISAVLDGEYEPPTPFGSFAGVVAHIEDPSGSRVIDLTNSYDYDGDWTAAVGSAQRRGHFRITYPQPLQAASTIRVYLTSRSQTLTRKLVFFGDHGASPSVEVTLSQAMQPPPLPISVSAYEAYAERKLDQNNDTKTFIYCTAVLEADNPANRTEWWLSMDNGQTWGFVGSPGGWLGYRWIGDNSPFEIYAPLDGDKTCRVKAVTHSDKGSNNPIHAIVSQPFTIRGVGSPPATGVITNAEFSYTLDLDNVPWAFYPVVRWKANPLPGYHGTALTVKLYNAAGQLHPDPKYQGDGQETGWWTNIGDQVYDSNPLGWMLPPPDEPLDGYRYYRLYLWAVNRNYERTLALAWPGGASYGVMYVPESRRQDPPAVHPAAPNITAATAETYYADANGTENVDGPHFGFRGTVTLPTAHADYSHLRAIQIFATHPDGHRELIAILTEWEFGTATLNWKGIVRARPESDVVFPKIEFECVNDDTRITPNPYTISNVTVLGRISTSVPDVAVFHVGRSLGDGTFAAECYTDELCTKMLVDWACVLPNNLGNWHGVAIWVRTPANHYVQVTNVLELTEFKKSEGGAWYLYDTRAFTLDDIPDPPETWTFIAVSYNHLVEPNRDLQGNPRGRTVDLQTLPKGNHVLNLQVQRVPGQQLDESGNQTWSYVCTWNKPPLPRYTAIRIMQEGWFGPGEYQQMTGNIPREETKAVVGPHPMPPESRTLKVYAQPVFGDDTVIPLAQCPYVEITIAPHVGEAGREHADLVTDVNAVVADPPYAVNAQGQKVLRVNITWQRPTDVRYSGAQVWVIWYDGQHHQLTGNCTQEFFFWESGHFPAATQQATFYVLSVDKAGRSNSYVPSVTPSKAINIPPPPLGPTGQEYTSSIPYGVYGATVSYPNTADGTYNAVITAYFAPPADLTWGGVELVLRDSTGDKPMLRTNATPAVLTVPVPDTSQSWSLYFVSYDVNGRRNSITTGTPMVSLYVGSAAGKLRLNRADPNSIELNHFTIVNNKLRIFQIDGDLIVSGTISSAHLHTNGIDVGGGSGMPGQLRVWNAYGQQIGYIGVDGGDDTWLKALKVGGPNKNNPHIISRADGTTDIIDASLTISKLGIEISVNAEQDSQYVRGICVKNTQPGYGNRRILIGDNQVWAVGYSGNLNFTLINYSRQDFFDFGALTLAGAGGRWVTLNENNSGNVQCSHDVLANGTVRGANFSVFSFGQERPGLNYEVYDRDGKKLTFLAGLLVSVV